MTVPLIMAKRALSRGQKALLAMITRMGGRGQPFRCGATSAAASGP
jgi:hypothetical protein